MDSDQVGARSIIGGTLGHYKIRTLLGAGGMGSVYRGYDQRLKRDVAIKLVPPNVAEDSNLMGRLKRETNALAGLNHPHIEAIYSVEEADGFDFLVLELVEGEILAQRLTRGILPLSEALAIARQVAEALEAAHSRGVIHRDLKPSNVSVTPDGRVKLLDFGLAKLEGAARHSGSQTTLRLAVGTVGYMSPEQIMARGAIDQRTDIWAFGCLLFELLAAQLAFPATNASAALAAIATGQPNWEALPRGTPSKIRQLIRTCLEGDPARRPPSMKVVRDTVIEVKAEDEKGPLGTG